FDLNHVEEVEILRTTVLHFLNPSCLLYNFIQEDTKKLKRMEMK
ncbi:hypothetical protein LINPERPRIM_LOCUS36280, partial [Linum perenne]